jgi:hypothetical protein
MGLLDDAIREHLELKRRRGADPSEVAREQQEVLEGASHEGHVPRVGDIAPAGGVAPGAIGEIAPAGAARARDRIARAQPTTCSADLSPVDQETAELDMGTVLDEKLAIHSDGLAPAAPAVAGPAGSSEVSEEGRLNSEFPEEPFSVPTANAAHPAQGGGYDSNTQTAAEPRE